MDAPAPAPAAAPAQGNEQDQGAGGDPVKALTGIQQALFGVNQAMQGSQQVPPEAQKHLQGALSEYNSFLSIMGKSMGIDIPGADDDAQMGNQSSEAQGSRGAVPADMPMKAGAKPMMG
jgi:hypothetical protein